MPNVGDLILVHLVEKRPLGARFTRTRHEWPLHITVMPWFTVPDETATVKNLVKAAANFPAFAVRVGERQWFGVDHDVPVNIIQEKDQPQMRQLHMTFLKILRDAGASFVSEQFMGERHRAHITKHDTPDGERHEGDIERIDDVHLVRLLDGNICEVLQRIPLGSDNA